MQGYPWEGCLSLLYGSTVSRRKLAKLHRVGTAKMLNCPTREREGPRIEGRHGADSHGRLRSSTPGPADGMGAA
eukprot:2084455-Pyramimonas_sp.AAC.1